MTPIEVINKTGGGRRDAFTQSPVTFGRDPACNVVVAGSFVSRRHGELVEDADHWRIMIQSANGAEVNGKRVGKRGRVLRDQDVVTVGGEIVFEVRLAEASTTTTITAPATDDEEEDGATGPQRKSRVWIWIGVYLLLMLGLYVFLATLKDKKVETVPAAAELTRQQITDVIRGPLPQVPPDERLAIEQLAIARELVERPESAVDARYRAYIAYRQSLAYAGRRTFEQGLDQRRYMHLQSKLIDQIVRQYSTAYEKLRSGQYKAAEGAFRQLTLMYPDPQSRIHRNVEAQRKIAVENYKKQRSRRRR